MYLFIYLSFFLNIHTLFSTCSRIFTSSYILHHQVATPRVFTVHGVPLSVTGIAQVRSRNFHEPFSHHFQSIPSPSLLCLSIQSRNSIPIYSGFSSNIKSPLQCCSDSIKYVNTHHTVD